MEQQRKRFIAIRVIRNKNAKNIHGFYLTVDEFVEFNMKDAKAGSWKVYEVKPDGRTYIRTVIL